MNSTLFDIQKAFACITQVRAAKIRKVVMKTVASINNMNENNPELREYFKIDTRRKADFRRLHMYCNLNLEFSGDNKAAIRQETGGLVLVLDGTHALHFKDNSHTRLSYVPKWVDFSIVDAPEERIIQVYEQLSLDPSIAENKRIEVGPPLRKLIALEAKYTVDEIDGTINSIFIYHYALNLELPIDLEQPITTMEIETQELKTQILKKA